MINTTEYKKLKIKLNIFFQSNNHYWNIHQTHDGPVTERVLNSLSNLLFVGDFKGKSSVAFQQIKVDGLFEKLWRAGNILVLELDLALSALVVLGSNVVVEELEGQNHVVEGGNVEGKGLVPDRVHFALFGGRDLDSVVLVTELLEI